MQTGEISFLYDEEITNCGEITIIKRKFLVKKLPKVRYLIQQIYRIILTGCVCKMMKIPVLVLCFIFTSFVATSPIIPNDGWEWQSTSNSVGGILDKRGHLTGKQCGYQTNNNYWGSGTASSTEQDWSLKSAQFYAYCFEQVIQIFFRIGKYFT